MTRFALAADRIFDGHSLHGEAVVHIEGGLIASITSDAGAFEPVDRWGKDVILAPGYIDLQVNGGGGIMLNAAPTSLAMAAIAAAHARTGTTSILPTLITDTPDKLRAALLAAREAIAAGAPGVAGLHLEGPFLNPVRHGAHPQALVRPLGDDDIALLTQPFPGPMLVTLAPEMVTPAQIAALVRAGVIVFAGHSDATYEQAMAALDAGMIGFTHLFNAMPPITSRAPGPAAAALLDPRARAGIIADAIHVHPASLTLALRMMGPERLFAVSDAMATVGSDITSFDLCGDRVELHDGRLLNQAGGLAGAHITMAECVRNLVRHAGADWEAALRMATATPAETLNLTDRGRIAPGQRADLVALSADLDVLAVWQGGVRL
jgi:N-acetylglucosamine-6-phosphate deacetylase